MEGGELFDRLKRKKRFTENGKYNNYLFFYLKHILIDKVLQNQSRS